MTSSQQYAWYTLYFDQLTENHNTLLDWHNVARKLEPTDFRENLILPYPSLSPHVHDGEAYGRSTEVDLTTANIDIISRKDLLERLQAAFANVKEEKIKEEIARKQRELAELWRLHKTLYDLYFGATAC